MARPLPLPVSEPRRSGTNGSHPGHTASAGPLHLHAAADEASASLNGQGSPSHNGTRPADIPEPAMTAAEEAEMEHLRSENAQLRNLCVELEQALQEASQQLQPDLEQQIREYDAVLEEKTEMIRQLHSQLQETQAALEEVEASASQSPGQRPKLGPTPGEDELLALSEELERERRQLQEDEQSLMDQMREMEVSMARERAEMARQRNDLQRLQNDIRHELERLERNGALQSKIESLKNKLTDVTTRRGTAPGAAARPVPSAPTPPPATAPARKEGLMGRLFGQGK